MKTLCLNFCSYYKPGKREEAACRGYRVVERLLHEGREIRFERSGSQCDGASRDSIVRKLCIACDFRQDGCDFIRDRNAPPCGGLLLLSQLIAEGAITTGDI